MTATNPIPEHIDVGKNMVVPMENIAAVEFHDDGTMVHLKFPVRESLMLWVPDLTRKGYFSMVSGDPF